MLIVRKKQLEVFEDIFFEDFLFRMTLFVKENFNTTKTDDEIKEEIKLIIKEAEKYGFETEETIEQYLFLKWKYPAFQAKPLSDEILQIITYPDREPQKIIDELIFLFENNSET